MRAGDGEHIGEALHDDVGFIAHAAGDDHPAILGHRLANRLEALLLGAVEKTAGVDEHDIGAGIVCRHVIAVAAQLGQDALAVDQCLGTAERDHAHFGRRRDLGCHIRGALGAFCRRVTPDMQLPVPGLDLACLSKNSGRRINGPDPRGLVRQTWPSRAQQGG